MSLYGFGDISVYALMTSKRKYFAGPGAVARAIYARLKDDPPVASK
jgi:hypothetical protein